MDYSLKSVYNCEYCDYFDVIVCAQQCDIGQYNDIYLDPLNRFSRATQSWQ